VAARQVERAKDVMHDNIKIVIDNQPKLDHIVQASSAWDPS
jgi:hypothetical protein